MDEAVVICPVMPMELPKVVPISMSSRLDIIPGIPVTNLEKERIGRTILPGCEGLSIVSLLKIISLAYSSLEY